jgi:serine/threonine protein kinase
MSPLCLHAQVMACDGLQGASEFDNERLLLSRLHHAHLVRLLGVCISAAPPLRCLVYELMPGGNVEEQLQVGGGAAGGGAGV